MLNINTWSSWIFLLEAKVKGVMCCVYAVSSWNIIQHRVCTIRMRTRKIVYTRESNIPCRKFFITPTSLPVLHVVSWWYQQQSGHDFAVTVEELVSYFLFLLRPLSRYRQAYVVSAKKNEPHRIHNRSLMQKIRDRMGAEEDSWESQCRHGSLVLLTDIKGSHSHTLWSRFTRATCHNDVADNALRMGSACPVFLRYSIWVG